MPLGHLVLPTRAAGSYRVAWAPPRKSLTPASAAAVGMRQQSKQHSCHRLPAGPLQAMTCQLSRQKQGSWP